MKDKIVYSTEEGDLRGEKKGRGKDRKKPQPSGIKNDGIVRVRREKTGRGGKTVSVIHGLPAGTDLKALSKELKKKCGSGGTVRDDVIEIQGDAVDRIVELLAKKGFTAKQSGG